LNDARLLPASALAAAALAALIARGDVALAAGKSDATDACIQASDEGQVLRDRGKLLAARARFLACSRDACPRLVRTDCAGWLADVDARIPSIVVSAQDPAGRDAADVKVTLNGEVISTRLDGLAIPVDPGEHRFRFERSGSPPIEETILLREGERRRAVSVRFRDPNAPREDAPKTPAPAASGPSTGTLAAAITLGAAGLAGGGAFAYLAATAKSDRDHLRETCAPGCKQADVDAIRTKEIAANVALGAGIAAIASGVLVLTLGPRKAPASATISVLPGGGALSIGGRF
jgi:hypothetical protein